MLLLLKTLELYGLKGVTLGWFISYLSNRQQQCVVGGCVSKPQLTSYGVPQGSILDPLLFSIYINDLPACLVHTKAHMYAVDTTIYASSLSTAELHFCSSLRENTQSFALNGLQLREETFMSAKVQTFAHKSDSITIFAF